VVWYNVWVYFVVFVECVVCCCYDVLLGIVMSGVLYDDVVVGCLLCYF